MMSDWQIINLGKIAEIKRGLASQHLSYVDNEKEGIRLIRINDFKSDAPKYIKETKDTKKLIIKKGDVLIAGTGATAGISFLVDELWDGLPFSYNAPRIRVKNGNDSKFIYYTLNSEEIISQQKRLFTGNAQPFLDTRAIASFKITLPPLSEQQKIAEILSTVDDKIDVIDQQIIETQALKKGLMQRLLTKGIGHTEFKDSPLGEIPESWEVVELGSLLKKIKGGGTPSKEVPAYWNGNIPWATVKDLKKHILSDTIDYISESGLKNSSANLIPAWILITSTRMALGRAVFFDKNVAINQDLKALYTNERLNKFYLFHWFSRNADYILSLGSGSTVKGIRLEVLKSLKIALPQYSEQQKIASILSSVDDKLEVLSDKKTHYQVLKQGLMQQLLTGKIRVAV